MGKIEHGLTAVADQLDHLNHALVTRKIHHMDSSRDPLSSLPARALHKAAALIDGAVVVDLSVKHGVLEIAAYTAGKLENKKRERR